MADRRVRAARPQDAPFLTRNIIRLARETEGLDLEPGQVQTGVTAVLTDGTKGFYLVAEGEDGALGQVLITPEWSDWRAGYYWWLQSVYVVETHRRLGVFKDLFDSVVERAEAAGNVRAIKLYVDGFNQAAQDSYLRLGMSPSHYRLYEIAL